jgi:hypothetical protein
VRVVPKREKHSFMELAGILYRPGQKALSDEEIKERVGKAMAHKFKPRPKP